MDIKALQFETRFSLPPNSLGYCGRDTAARKFKQCIINDECGGVEKEVKKFIVLYPYLRTISSITKLPKFSYEVIESYWIGNDLLKKFKPEHYYLLLKYFEKQGVPDFFVKELGEKPPKIFIPNHLFHVLYIGVGKASGTVPFNLESINNCMIRWGKVTKIQNEKAVINLHSLLCREAKTLSNPPLSGRGHVVSPPDKGEKEGVLCPGYSLIVSEETVPFNHELVQGIKTGDIVSVHWNMIVKILTKDEEEKLKYWTKQCLALF